MKRLTVFLVFMAVMAQVGFAQTPGKVPFRVDFQIDEGEEFYLRAVASKRATLECAVSQAAARAMAEEFPFLVPVGPQAPVQIVMSITLASQKIGINSAAKSLKASVFKVLFTDADKNPHRLGNDQVSERNWAFRPANQYYAVETAEQFQKRIEDALERHVKSLRQLLLQENLRLVPVASVVDVHRDQRGNLWVHPPFNTKTVGALLGPQGQETPLRLALVKIGGPPYGNTFTFVDVTMEDLDRGILWGKWSEQYESTVVGSGHLFDLEKARREANLDGGEVTPVEGAKSFRVKLPSTPLEYLISGLPDGEPLPDNVGPPNGETVALEVDAVCVVGFTLDPLSSNLDLNYDSNSEKACELEP